MPPRSTWKGFLKLSLVSVPVKAYTASASGGGEIHLNQLHNECHSRIQYKKTCPIHGEVSNDDIVSGYEYAKGQYVVVDTDELDKLRTEDDKAINIQVFVPPEAIDPVYFSGRTYYLLPDGPVGTKPYAVLLKAMVEENRYAVAQVVFHGKEQLVLVRPLDNLFAMTILDYESQITKPSTFQEEAPSQDAAPDELKLAKTLIEASSTDDFELSAYRDVYTEKLTQLIEAKVAGKEIVAAPAQEHAHVINLMDALQKSVAQLKETKKGAAPAAAKPPKKMAPSKAKEEPETRVRKRKSS